MHFVRSAVATLLFFAPLATAFAQNPTTAIPVNAAQRQQVIATLGKQLKANYIFADVADKVAAALSSKAAGGAYDDSNTAAAFAEALTTDLHGFGKDVHFHVDYDANFKPQADDGKPPTKEELAENKKEAEQLGFGITKVQRLAGNVGYLKIRGFFPADFVASAYGAAMNLLSGTDAMILDLRQNNGGDPSAVATLLSYFFAEGDNRHLNDLYYRAAHRTQEYWTIPVAGARYSKPVYVLTSPDTFSGGEECAYDFQTQKRGIVVGQTTGGGANPGDMFVLGHHFVAFIPTGRAINPVTRTNWEHVGVKPDVPVPAIDAMKVAYVAALESLIPKAADPDELRELKITLAKVEKGEIEPPDYVPRN